MSKDLIKTRKDHRKLRALIAENTVTQTMTPNAGALTAGEVGSAYGPVTFALSAPVGSAAYSVSAGALPPGLTLSGAGVLSGTPTDEGSYSFSVRGTDEFGNTKVNAYTLAIAGE